MRIKSAAFGILWLVFFGHAFGEENIELKKADSLFQAQKYTEAFAIYEDILSTGNATSAMLLKMAFIQDASDRYTDALYYLDLYYRVSADRLAVGKIEEIADEHQLSGYRYNDSHYFIALYGKFKLQIVILLFSISILLFAYVMRKTKVGEKPYVASFFQVLSLVLLILISNFRPSSNAIITSDQTLLRSGPSAGAEPIEMISKGHKVKVVGQSEVWTIILWGGEEVFIRNSRLKLI